MVEVHVECDRRWRVVRARRSRRVGKMRIAKGRSNGRAPYRLVSVRVRCPLIAGQNFRCWARTGIGAVHAPINRRIKHRKSAST